MAALIDNSAKIASITAGATLETGSWTIGGSNRVLYVLVCSGASTPTDPTGCKWGGSGGTDLTQLGSTLNIGSNWKASLWRLINPTEQSSTVYATWGANDDERWMFCVSVKDAHQTTPNGVVATNSGNGTSQSVDVATEIGDLVLSFIDSSAYADSVATSQTPLQEYENGTPYAFISGGCDYDTAASTTTNMAWSCNQGSFAIDWGMFGLAIKAAASEVPTGFPEPLPPQFGVFRRVSGKAG